MGKKLKIAMIGQKGIPAVYGGIERHVEEISGRLVAKGHSVTVYCRPYYMKENGYFDKNTDVENVDLKILKTIKTKHLDAIVHSLVSGVDAIFGNYDIVHYHALGPSTVSFINRLFGVKTVVTVHGLDWRGQKWSFLASSFLRIGEKTSYYFPNKTVTVSKSLKNYYDEKYNTDVVYIPNGVNIPKSLEPNIIKGKYGIDKDSYLVFISRLVPEKGCHNLIEVYKKIKTDKKLLIVGGGSHSDAYVDKLHDLASDDERIIFTGSVSGNELAELFSNAYLFVLPTELEGLPIVILEALSFSKCVLVSNIPENMEIISPVGTEKYGYSFENKNVDDLKNKLEFLLANPDKVETMSKIVKKYVEKNFNWDSVSDDTEKLYQSLIND